MKRIAAGICTAVALLPLLTRAEDLGPGKPVSAVRWAAGKLLAARAHAWGVDPSAIVVSSVVTDGAYGLADWTAGSRHGLEGFAYIWDRWWIVMQTRDGNPPSFTCSRPLSCPPEPAIPTAAFLKDAGFPQTIVDRATALPIVAQSNERKDAGARPASSPLKNSFDAIGGTSASLGGDGYDASMHFASNDSARTVEYTLVTRRPTQAESWVSFPGGNAWVYFTISVANDAPVNVKSGTTLDIWCPFVLDSNMKYSLTISKTSEPVGPLDASVHDNTMHFVLPSLTIPPHAELLGVVDGNP